MNLTDSPYYIIIKHAQYQFIACDEVLLENEDSNVLFAPNTKPTIFKQASQSWTLMKRWSGTYLRENFGNLPCTIARDMDTKTNELYLTNLTFGNYFDEHLGASAFHRVSLDSNTTNPFIGELDFPNKIVAESAILDVLLYHAELNWGALPHIHNTIALNLLQKGLKLWIFFDANPSGSQTGAALALSYAEQYGHVASSTKWFKNELLKLSNRNYQIYYCIQEAGDIVLVPDNYCHAVLNLEDSQGLIIMLKNSCNEIK
jgi:hypothetical protein